MSTPQPAQPTPRRYRLFIDGQFVDAESGKTFKSPNPATGETFAEVAEADQADVDRAVAAARKAFEGKWSKMTARDRGRLLYKLTKLIQEAGFPEGVVNIIPGFGETAGAALASHKGIDKIAFTGSTEVGKVIAKTAAENLTKVSLELGGKAPNIIFADADLDQAVNGAMMGIFFNQGQVCCAGSRLFVEAKVKDAFLARFKEKADKIKVGDPMDKATLMGPQVSEDQLNKIKSYVDIAREEGATVFAGGERPQLEAQFQNGYFFQPTIFSEVNNSMRVA